MKRLSRSALLGAALALAAGSACAAGSTPGFSALDKNHDGSLSRAEAAGNPALAAQFAAADRNHDGKLSRFEYLTAMAKQDFNAAKDKISGMMHSRGSGSAGASGHR